MAELVIQMINAFSFGFKPGQEIIGGEQDGEQHDNEAQDKDVEHKITNAVQGGEGVFFAQLHHADPGDVFQPDGWPDLSADLFELDAVITGNMLQANVLKR